MERLAVVQESEQNVEYPTPEIGHDVPDMGKDQADVVTAAAEDREQSIARRSLERAAFQPTVVFHVADGGFDGAPATDQLAEPGRDTVLLATEKDLA